MNVSSLSRGRIWFVLVAVLFLVSAGALQRGNAFDVAQFKWSDQPDAGTADLTFAGFPVLRYMYAYDSSTPERNEATFKIFHHIYGPGSTEPITKGFVAKSLFPHHRGLFFAWNKTTAEGKTYDFWHCTKGAHQRHVKFLEKKGDERRGTMTAEIHWNDEEGKPVVVEERTISVEFLSVDQSPGHGWQIDFTSKLSSRRGTITFDGDRQHSGVQFRAAQPVEVAKNARYVRPAGFPEKPEAFEVDDKKDPEGHINLGWLTMSYELDGKRYNVQYCEDPALPKPSRFSERPYGRFGAFFKAQLEPEKPLIVRYRLFVTPGETPSREVMQKRFDAFAASLGGK